MNKQEDSSPSKTLFTRVAEKYKENSRLEMPEGDLSLSEIWRQLCSRLDMDDTELASIVAELAGLEVAPPLNKLQEELVSKVPFNIASTYRLIPFAKNNNTVLIAISNPFDEAMHELISFIFGINTRCFVTPPDAIEVAITAAYEKLGGEAGNKQIELDEYRVDDMIDRQVPRLARQLLKKALAKGASDLHVQDFVGGAAVRIRVDGILQRMVILPTTVAAGLIRYFKALGSMDPTSSLRPQDGRVAVKLEDQEYDLRLSVIPTQGGKEKLVVRFLNRSKIYKLSAKSFSLEEIHTLRRLAASPSGVVLICGPTGSGKTTTLYSILSELNDEQVSISTVENPVEYSMAGLAQTEVNEKAGMTFSGALRSILRQDPDIILIGEIRDQETAQIAMQSALTGHLVFSTLHTNDALSAIPRLMDLGVPNAILVEALVGLVSQRLLRRLCANCKEPVTGKISHIEEGFKAVTHVNPGARPNGCEHCNYTGYQGRVVVSEMFEIDSSLRKLIQKGEVDIDKLHSASGVHNQNLSISASRLIISGETTVEEAVRVIGRHFWIELAQEYKTELPDMSLLNVSGQELLSDVQPLVLLVGPPQNFSEALKGDIEHAWYEILMAGSPDEAKTVLQENEEIKFVILAIDHALSDDECLGYVAEYRRAMAWSRLPALILLPDGRDELQVKLVADGATSRFMFESTDSANIIEVINKALAENLDFSWGVAAVGAQQTVE